MATEQGEKTEKPSAKRIKDAREKGQVARSKDLSSALSLAAATLMLSWYGARMATTVAHQLALALTSVGERARTELDSTTLITLFVADAGVLAVVVGPIAVAAAVASVMGSVAQTGFVYAPKVIGFNWGRLSPASGFAKFSPMQAGPELFKTLLGTAALVILCYGLVRPAFEGAPALVGLMPAELAKLGWTHVWTLLWRGSLTLAVLALLDFGYQRWRWYSNLKMTRKELRDESKQNEANPEMKGKIRKIQRDMARQRMMHAVKTATVVITNPTHFAVALEYRRSEMSAPKVVAKGQDAVAARIRAVAREHNVPIVENVTLARALYKAADIGDSIPGDLFGAVAEVLAYLVRLKQVSL